MNGRRVLLAASLLLLGALGVGLFVARQCRVLDCVSGGEAAARCANVTTPRLVQKLPLSDAQELIIESATATRRGAFVSLELSLKGRFWNESDQNLYLFIGRTPPAAPPASYALSSDTKYFTDLPYKVRAAAELPHSNDIRIGIMAPRESAYTPQVYSGDAVHTDAVGREAHVGVEASEHLVRISLPLDELYGRRQLAAPERVSLTAATARDYVGFIDQLSVTELAAGETKQAGPKTAEPVLYPTLDYDSHLLKSVSLGEREGSVRVEIETAAEIEDWAQTNLNFFFVPYPPQSRTPRPLDPSKAVLLPFPWSFYCGVYSPSRTFCKASGGTDFTYDEGYAERSALGGPAGVRFSALGGARYALELGAENVKKIKAGGDAFALLITTGRDGFGPTSVYGWDTSGRCKLARSIFGAAAPTTFPQLLCP
ncbi:MAG TPA: hypothetical protein VF521_03745 [Pyrinomonadaceae bacterium]